MTDRKTAEEVIRELLLARAPDKTICPSDAAKAIAGPEGFRPHMDEVRNAARAMVARGELDVTQRGTVVDLDDVRGPVRLRLRSRDESDPAQGR